MAKFIDVETYNLKNCDTDIVINKTILLNVEDIKTIEVRRYSSGYAILVITEYDWYAYNWNIAAENEAYKKMFELQEKLNK